MKRTVFRSVLSAFFVLGIGMCKPVLADSFTLSVTPNFGLSPLNLTFTNYVSYSTPKFAFASYTLYYKIHNNGIVWYPLNQSTNAHPTDDPVTITIYTVQSGDITLDYYVEDDGTNFDNSKWSANTSVVSVTSF